MLKRLLPNITLILVAVVLTAIVQPLRPFSTFAQQADCQAFKETGKSVCGRFLQYWQSQGGLAQQGYPISGEFTEVSELNGKSYTVQYFERAVFELHPENQPPNDVLLAQLGTLAYKRKYGTAQTPTAPVPTPQPPGPTAAPATATPGAAGTAQAPPTLWVNLNGYAERNGVTFTVFRADITRDRIDIHYLVENETAAPIPMTLLNAEQLVADNDYNLYPPLDPKGSVSIVLQPNQNYSGTTSFSGNAYYNRAIHITYGINNVPNLGNVRVRIQMPPK